MLKHDEARRRKYERILRRLRARIFAYDDDATLVKATRVLLRAKDIVIANTPPPPVDEWGATAEDRRMLARHGLAWMD